jgi:hypothetical protein
MLPAPPGQLAAPPKDAGGDQGGLARADKQQALTYNNNLN